MCWGDRKQVEDLRKEVDALALKYQVTVEALADRLGLPTESKFAACLREVDALKRAQKALDRHPQRGV